MKDLDTVLEVAEKREKSLLYQVKSRFKKYSAEITEIEKGALNFEQEDLVKDIKQVLKELNEDINTYESGKKNFDFKSEYSETEEYFEKEGFQKAEDIWFSPSYKTLRTVPFGREENFTLAEKSKIVFLFAGFSNTESQNLIQDIKRDSSIFLEQGEMNFEKLEKFLLNLKKYPDIKNLYFKLRSQKSACVLARIISNKPQNLGVTYERLKGKSRRFLYSITSHSAESLLVADNLNDVMEVSHLFLNGGSADYVAKTIYNNPKYKDDPIFQEYFQNHKEDIRKRESEESETVEKITERELTNSRIEEKVTLFIQSLEKDPIDGLYFDASKYREYGLRINKTVQIYFNEDMTIKRVKSNYCIDHWSEWFSDEFKKTGIKKIDDIREGSALIIDIFNEGKKK